MVLRILALMVACLLAVLTPSVARAAGLEGKPAPALAAADFAGAKRALPEIAAGRPAVVLFWASWCPYCKALMPPLAALARELGDARLVVVAVNVWEEDPAAGEAFVREAGHPFVWLRGGGKLAKRWGVRGTPGLYLVDAAGKVRYDRNARPLKPGALPPGADANASARWWLGELRREIDAAGAQPTD